MSFETKYDANFKVVRCTGYPKNCEECWNNPCRLKQATDIRKGLDDQGNKFVKRYCPRCRKSTTHGYKTKFLLQCCECFNEIRLEEQAKACVERGMEEGVRLAGECADRHRDRILKLLEDAGISKLLAAEITGKILRPIMMEIVRGSVYVTVDTEKQVKPKGVKQ